VIAGLRDRGTCVVVTTHELTEAERLADRMVVLHRGRLLASGTPAELAAGVTAQVRFTSSPALDVGALGGVLGTSVVEDQPGSYRAESAPSPQLTAALATWLAERGAPLIELRTAASLEETYLALVGSEGLDEPDPSAGLPRRGRRGPR
jgi:ABC-2 type transport system ATP-binding protein